MSLKSEIEKLPRYEARDEAQVPMWEDPDGEWIDRSDVLDIVASVKPQSRDMSFKTEIEQLHCYQDCGQNYIDGFEDCRKSVLAILKSVKP